jgi:hypothetical protein
MAPAPKETPERLVRRLRAHAHLLEVSPLRFGVPHHTHAVLRQDGSYRVRRLQLPEGARERSLRERGHFMPEDAERLSEPTGEVVLEAGTLDELIALIQGSSLLA